MNEPEEIASLRAELRDLRKTLAEIRGGSRAVVHFEGGGVSLWIASLAAAVSTIVLILVALVGVAAYNDLRNADTVDQAYALKALNLANEQKLRIDQLEKQLNHP